MGNDTSFPRVETYVYKELKGRGDDKSPTLQNTPCRRQVEKNNLRVPEGSCPGHGGGGPSRGTGEVPPGRERVGVAQSQSHL